MSDQNANLGNPKKSMWMQLSLLIVAILTIWAGMGFFAYIQGWEDRGTFGDMFGAVNALFTGLAFAGVVMTIVLQMKEMEDTRDVLKEQQKLMSDANFFRMLEMFRHMAQNMRHPGGVPSADEDRFRQTMKNIFPLNNDEERKIVGIEYWRLLVKVCQHEMNDANPQLIEKRWSEIYRRWDTSLGPYFATLAELLLLISEAEEKQGKRWANILRAQLGLQEMLPIFFYALSPAGQGRLKPHIEKFGIFAHFSNDPAYHKIAPDHLYAASAFSPKGSAQNVSN